MQDNFKEHLSTVKDWETAVSLVRVPGGGYLVMPDGAKRFFNNGAWSDQEFNEYIKTTLKNKEQQTDKLYDPYNRKDGKAY